MDNKSHCNYLDDEFNKEYPGEYFSCTICNLIPISCIISIRIVIKFHEKRIDNDNNKNKIIKYWPSFEPYKSFSDSPFGFTYE